jgi:cytoskeleton protein RodZ
MTIPNETQLDLNPTAESNSIDAESVGTWLAQTRTGSHTEQSEVARHLGLNSTIIQAIETNDFGRLGPPVFVRSYLSRYARLLNLPEQLVLERYQLQSGISESPPPLKVMHPLRRQTRIRDLRGVFYLLLLIIITWTAIQNLNNLDPSRLVTFWSDAGDNKPGNSISDIKNQNQHYQIDSEPLSSQPLVTENPLEKPNSGPTSLTSRTTALSDGISALSASSILSIPTHTEPTIVSPVSQGITAAISPPVTGLLTPDGISPASITETIDTSSAVPNTELKSVAFAGEAKLLLEFSNDCWIEVRDAQGNLLANGLMKANSARTISGMAPFKVALGNAPAARIVLDDRLINTEVYLPRHGTVSRFILDKGRP